MVRKPGAFANYRFREDLFPTSRFRMAYDLLCQQAPAQASKEYLSLLHLAAKESEVGVDDALRFLLGSEQPLTAEAVETLVRSGQQIAPPTQIAVEAVDLRTYDRLLSTRLAEVGI